MADVTPFPCPGVDEHLVDLRLEHQCGEWRCTGMLEWPRRSGHAWVGHIRLLPQGEDFDLVHVWFRLSRVHDWIKAAYFSPVHVFGAAHTRLVVALDLVDRPRFSGEVLARKVGKPISRI